MAEVAPKLKAASEDASRLAERMEELHHASVFELEDRAEKDRQLHAELHELEEQLENALEKDRQLHAELHELEEQLENALEGNRLHAELYERLRDVQRGTRTLDEVLDEYDWGRV